jgi:hypothetical protein
VWIFLKTIQKWLHNIFLKKYGFGCLYRDFFTCGNTFGHVEGAWHLPYTSIGSYYPDTENTPNEWQGKWSNKKAGKCATRMGLWLGIVNTKVEWETTTSMTAPYKLVIITSCYRLYLTWKEYGIYHTRVTIICSVPSLWKVKEFKRIVFVIYKFSLFFVFKELNLVTFNFWGYKIKMPNPIEAKRRNLWQNPLVNIQTLKLLVNWLTAGE